VAQGAQAVRAGAFHCDRIGDGRGARDGIGGGRRDGDVQCTAVRDGDGADAERSVLAGVEGAALDEGAAREGAGTGEGQVTGSGFAQRAGAADGRAHDGGVAGGHVKREKSVLYQERAGEAERAAERHVAGAGLREPEVCAVGIGHAGRDGQFCGRIVVAQRQQRLVALGGDLPLLHEVGLDRRAVGVRQRVIENKDFGHVAGAGEVGRSVRAVQQADGGVNRREGEGLGAEQRAVPIASTGVRRVIDARDKGQHVLPGGRGHGDVEVIGFRGERGGGRTFADAEVLIVAGVGAEKERVKIVLRDVVARHDQEGGARGLVGDADVA